jgi:hypothetical protein
MKWFFKILFLLIIALFCSASGCNDNTNLAEQREERQIASMRDTIRMVFETWAPDDKLLRGYEEVAKQKLMDFSDYLNISSDSTLDPAFRIQASKMAVKLFMSPGAEISGLNFMNSSAQLRIVSDLPDMCLESNPIPKMLPVNIRITDHMRQLNDTTYKGSLAFSMKYADSVSTSSLARSTRKFSAEIYLIKTVKTFGDQSFNTWDTRLGNIGNN